MGDDLEIPALLKEEYMAGDVETSNLNGTTSVSLPDNFIINYDTILERMRQYDPRAYTYIAPTDGNYHYHARYNGAWESFEPQGKSFFEDGKKEVTATTNIRDGERIVLLENRLREVERRAYHYETKMYAARAEAGEALRTIKLHEEANITLKNELLKCILQADELSWNREMKREILNKFFPYEIPKQPYHLGGDA